MVEEVIACDTFSYDGKEYCIDDQADTGIKRIYQNGPQRLDMHISYVMNSDGKDMQSRLRKQQMETSIEDMLPKFARSINKDREKTKKGTKR
jgi:hypothetical protein